MQNSDSIFRQLGRRRRAWISYESYGCLYDSTVCIVYRCPVVDGVPVVRLSWQHKVIPA